MVIGWSSHCYLVLTPRMPNRQYRRLSRLIDSAEDSLGSLAFLKQTKLYCPVTIDPQGNLHSSAGVKKIVPGSPVIAIVITTLAERPASSWLKIVQPTLARHYQLQCMNSVHCTHFWTAFYQESNLVRHPMMCQRGFLLERIPIFNFRAKNSGNHPQSTV